MPLVTRPDDVERIVTQTVVERVPGAFVPVVDPFSVEMDPFARRFQQVLDPLHDGSPGGPTAEQVFASLTVEQKAGQLSQFAVQSPFGTSGPVNPATWVARIERFEIGGLINVNESDHYRQFQEAAKTAGIPPVISAYDVIHGYRTIFPVNIGMAASFDRQMHYDYAEVAAKEALWDGIRWTYSPMLDISRDIRWGRTSETFGEDPYLAGELGVEMVKGYQANGVASCVKHFTGYGAPQAGRDYWTPQLGTAYHFNDYMPAYRKAAEAGALTFMGSYSVVDGVPVHAHRQLITDVLRGQWGWEGLFVSDHGAVGQVQNHRVAANGFEAANMTLTAGTDMDMGSGLFWEHFKETEDPDILRYMDLSLKRVLKIKEALGLLDNDYAIPTWTPAERWAHWATAESKAIAQGAAEKSMVLLKNGVYNSQRVLPLSRTGGKILLIGQLADHPEHQHGSWGGHGRFATQNEAYGATVTYKTAIEQAMGTANVEFVQGYEHTWFMNQDNLEAVDRAVTRVTGLVTNAAELADFQAIVIFAGEGQFQNGEGASRARMELPGVQKDMVRRIKTAAGTALPIVLCINAGRPQILLWENEHLDAILMTWASGTMGGPAAANILFGITNPSAKMPMTSPRAEGQIPIYYSALRTGRPNPNPADDRTTWDGPRMTISGYIDLPTWPLYWFGHGLSYSSFSYGTPTVSPASMSLHSGGQTITVTIQVTMTASIQRPPGHPDGAGLLPGTEIVQLYIRDRIASISPPEKRLRGFTRVTFTEINVPQTVTFTLNLSEDFGFYDNSLDWVVEPGLFDVIVASDAHVQNEDHSVMFEVTG